MKKTGGTQATSFITRLYTFVGRTLCLRLPSEALADLFDHIFSGFPASESSSADPPYHILESNNNYSVYRNDKLLASCTSSSELVAQLEWSILQHTFNTMPYLGLHAGVVAQQHTTLLLPGQSGAGKTSLVLGLLLRGATLLSDEVALIHPDTSKLYAFPRVLCIKNHTLNQFKILDQKNRLSSPGISIEINGVDCIAPGYFNSPPPKKPYAVTHIVFPCYRANRPTELTQISRAETLSLLMQHTVNRQKFPDRCLHILGTLVENTHGYKLAAGALEPALDCLEGLHLDPCHLQPPS